MIRALLLGTLFAAAYLAWECAPAIVRYRAMQAALLEVEGCGTIDDCERALARLKAVKP